MDSTENRRRLAGAFRLSDSLLALALLLVTFLATNIGRMPNGWEEFFGIRLTVKNLLLLGAFTAGWRAICTACGLYNWRRPYTRQEEVTRVLLAVAIGSCAALALPAVSLSGAFTHIAILYFGVSTACAMLTTRHLFRRALRRRAGPARNVLVVGSGPRGLEAYRELLQEAYPCQLVGFVDSIDGSLDDELQERVLGRLDDLESILMRYAVDEVLIALPVKSRYADIQTAIHLCEQVGVPIRRPADIFQFARARHVSSGDGFTVHSMNVAPDDHRMLVKRGIDIVGAATLLLLLSPVFLIAASAVWLNSPGPIFFSQLRFGWNKRQFRMLKFRTMVHDAEALQAALEARNEAHGPVFKIREDPRITPVGRVLRRTSIDELPQLVNVLRGEMSLVGPRPLPPRDVHRFTEAAVMRRFSVRPGITCLWQVNGRCNLSFEEWIRLDLQYIDEWSLALDAKILAQTVPAVLRGDGAA